MSFPNVNTLVNAVMNLAIRLIFYYVRAGSWNDVLVEWNRVYNWFISLRDYITAKIQQLLGTAVSALVSLINAVSNIANQAQTLANTAVAWINNTAQSVVNWVNIYRNRLTYVIDNVYNWLISFWLDPAGQIRAYLGSAWSWVVAFYNNAAGTIKAYLGSAWTWLASFYSNPWGVIHGFLGAAWDWLVGFYNDAAGTIRRYLGAAWTWLAALYADPYHVIAALLGPGWAWLLSLFGLNPAGLIAFVRDAMVYWYNTWSLYRSVLTTFLRDPVRFVLDGLAPVFIDWLVQLVADNWDERRY